MQNFTFNGNWWIKTNGSDVDSNSTEMLAECDGAILSESGMVSAGMFPCGKYLSFACIKGQTIIKLISPYIAFSCIEFHHSRPLSEELLQFLKQLHNQKCILLCELSPTICCRLRRTGVDSP